MQGEDLLDPSRAFLSSVIITLHFWILNERSRTLKYARDIMDTI